MTTCPPSHESKNQRIIRYFEMLVSRTIRNRVTHWSIQVLRLLIILPFRTSFGNTFPEWIDSTENQHQSKLLMTRIWVIKVHSAIFLIWAFRPSISITSFQNRTYIPLARGNLSWGFPHAIISYGRSWSGIKKSGQWSPDFKYFL